MNAGIISIWNSKLQLVKRDESNPFNLIGKTSMILIGHLALSRFRVDVLSMASIG